MDHIDSQYKSANVLVACTCPDMANTILSHLHSRGHNPIVVADRASVALAMAAQIPADIAIVNEDLGGVRSGRELADELRDTWGVPSLVVAGG
ncbi:hypothetical protein [Phenylobacterium kunshanense]|uniref:hypothetical protein n=1 Tax=Phenylobacterium kunshanense TaxID=1445034 RepID=UPI00197C07D7|nr:hypothetical protein [Phenylobacterium kunshanense]